MQHFIAEATKTVRLSDTRISDDVDDGLWVGCTTVNKEGRLCEVWQTDTGFSMHVSYYRYRKQSN